MDDHADTHADSLRGEIPGVRNSVRTGFRIDNTSKVTFKSEPDAGDFLDQKLPCSWREPNVFSENL